jgi:hypothetical protein
MKELSRINPDHEVNRDLLGHIPCRLPSKICFNRFTEPVSHKIYFQHLISKGIGIHTVDFYKDIIYQEKSSVVRLFKITETNQ